MQPQQPFTQVDRWHEGEAARAASYQPAHYPLPSYPASQFTPAAGFGESPASVVHWILPTGRSWQSIAAGYVGLVAIVAWFLGPVAVGLGVWALVKASRDGSHGRGRAVFGAVVGVLATVLFLAVLTTT
ncbi:DUF4190 domain-containing protein [Actinoplanes sp. NPDC049548]|uniref:DUF4190 domain-containing protein n=1 Tax=Actinoplanes sp. NPDC049548 TaxID=3155152 RepID=UPI003414BE3C